MYVKTLADLMGYAPALWEFVHIVSVSIRRLISFKKSVTPLNASFPSCMISSLFIVNFVLVNVWGG